MAVSSIKDFWIHPNALTITLNYFGDPQLIQTSMLAGAVIMAYRKDVISYDAVHNYREWKLQAFPTQLNDTCAYYVHAELSRGGDTAMIIYSPVKRDIEGRSFIDGAWDNTYSSSSWFIYLGEISSSVDEDGVPVERTWIDGFYTGTLDTDQQRMEEASGEWKTMFALNSVTGLIDVLKTISSATINALHVAKSLIFGGKTLTDVAGTGDTLDQSKVNDATLPTTGYTKKYVGDEIAVLDDHFLIKDTQSPQSVSGPVTFEKSVTVKGDHTVEGTQILHEGFRTPSYVEHGDLVQGAQVTKEGIASFAKVKTPSMQVYELTLNRKTAVQGEYVFSDGETIEEVTQLDEDTYQLRVREPYEGYVTTFKVDDILYSNINMLDSSAKTGKCWMFVTEVNGSTITAKMYAAAQCPSGENIAPIPHMTITRHGNRTDKTRQDLFVISSETSSLAMLRGVNAPIVSSEGLYGVVLGKLPSTLLDYIRKGGYEYVNGEDPYIYARGVIVQDLIMLDYQGKPIRQETYRGHWSAEVAKSDPYQSSLTAYDSVTHNGSLWQCMLAGTTAEPKEGIADWLIKVAKGDDASASIYELVPSANIIYYRTAEKTLSINTLDVKVGQTTSYGYSVIDEQNVLTELGLKVSYAIDGGGERHNINISPVAAYLLEDGTAILATEDGYGLSLEGEDINVDAIKDNITLYLTDTTTDKDMATYIIPVVKDGEQGKEGARGTSYYMAGELTFGTAYAEKDYIVKDINGNITDKPVFFRIPNGSDKPNYYVLQRGITAEENTELNLSNPSMWKPFTKMENLYAEFLMADWAKFGGPNGAIFYDKYLFSQKGIDKWGKEATWGKDMFDASGNLTGKFIPNMMFNFETGEAMLGRLTETLRTIEDPVVYMNSYRNAVVTPTAGYTGGGATQGFSKPLVILPQVGENNAFASGTRISIFAQVSTSNRDRNDTDDNFPLAGSYKAASTFALVSADDIVGGYIDTSGSYEGNWIMADGYRSKFLLIGAGEMVNMRLSVSEGMNIWVVENDADVTNMPCMIYGQNALHDTVSTVTASVNYNDYTGEDAWRTINSYGTSRDASWKLDNIVNNKNEYIPAVLATKSVRNSLNSTAFIGLKQPHIILSTNKKGWLDNYHYRLYDNDLDTGFTTITQLQ